MKNAKTIKETKPVTASDLKSQYLNAKNTESEVFTWFARLYNKLVFDQTYRLETIFKQYVHQSMGKSVDVHTIKMCVKYYEEVVSGAKKFEIRKNDRDYKVNDLLILQEYNNEENKYTGKMISAKVTYLTNFEQKEDFIVMGIQTFFLPNASTNY